MKPVINEMTQQTNRRTPHGVRGLKQTKARTLMETIHVAPLTGCVD